MRSLRPFVRRARVPVLALALAFSAAPAMAAGSGSDTQGSSERDVAAYAAHYGVSAKTASWRLDLQPAVGALDLRLASSAPESYAGLYIRHQPSFQVVVMFTVEPQANLEKFVDDVAIRPIAVALQAEYTLAELESQFNDTIALAKILRYDIQLSVVDNRVDLIATPESDVERAADESFPPSVKIDPAVHIGRPAIDIYGGLTISGCTSGFGVKNGAGTKGIVTAGHCNNTQSYGGTNLPYQSGQFSGSHDEQWHTAPGLTVKNWIKDSAFSTRTITSRTYRSAQAIGTWVCKYGASTGQTCGILWAKNFAPSFVPGALGTFHRVVPNGGPDLVNPGDSGGPVFVGNSAWGLVSGEYGAPWCICDLIYVAPDYIESLGISFLTS